MKAEVSQDGNEGDYRRSRDRLKSLGYMITEADNHPSEIYDLHYVVTLATLPLDSGVVKLDYGSISAFDFRLLLDLHEKCIDNSVSFQVI